MSYISIENSSSSASLSINSNLFDSINSERTILYKLITLNNFPNLFQCFQKEYYKICIKVMRKILSKHNDMGQI